MMWNTEFSCQIYDSAFTWGKLKLLSLNEKRKEKNCTKFYIDSIFLMEIK